MGQIKSMINRLLNIIAAAGLVLVLYSWLQWRFTTYDVLCSAMGLAIAFFWRFPNKALDRFPTVSSLLCLLFLLSVLYFILWAFDLKSFRFGAITFASSLFIYSVFDVAGIGAGPETDVRADPEHLPTEPESQLFCQKASCMRKLFSYRNLSRIRSYVVVGNLILGALLTTPEILTQVFMAIALQLLFEACVWTAWYRERQAAGSAETASNDTSAGDGT
jgi:hypothetical protein